MNLYKVLNVSASASISEIKAAHKKLVLKYHPDKTGGKTTEDFLDIQNAYEILSDDFKRGIYDGTFNNTGGGTFNNTGGGTFTEGTFTGTGGGGDIRMPANGEEWKILINKVGMHMIGFMQHNLFPKDIDVSLDVCMGDIYNRKFKKINVKVKIWNENDEFVTSSEIIYVDCSQCIEPITVFTFEKLGDASIFRAISRSDIVVTVNHILDEHIHMDRDFGMSLSIDLSLDDFNNKSTFEISAPGFNIEIPNMKKTSYFLENKWLYLDNKECGDLLILININS